MRILAIAAALAVGGFVVSAPAFAQQGAPAYVRGGPQQVGNWCKVISGTHFNSQFYGYYTPCAATAKASVARTSLAYEPERHERR